MAPSAIIQEPFSPDAKTPTRTILSLADLDEIQLLKIAQACNEPIGNIEDVYSCTPLQLSMIDSNRDEVLHFVLSYAPRADIDRFCIALRQVVAMNPALRTRFVRCTGMGIVQVVTNNVHVTERYPGGDVEEYLREGHLNGRASGKGPLGVPLFGSVFFDKHLVVTMHHAIMDYWAVTMLLNVDVPAVAHGHPNHRAPFKNFVAHYLSTSEIAARSFWNARFKGPTPAIYPAVKSSIGTGSSPRVVAKGDRKVDLPRLATKAIPQSHLPYFIEAAWALTASIFTDSPSVAYGYVLSGRSPTPTGVETTLGPTIVEVPVQVHLPRRTMTIEALVKDRASAMNQLQQNAAFMYYGLDKISALSEAAKTAAEFRTLINIRPVLPTGDAGEEDAPIKFTRLVWLGGSYALQLVFSILDDGVMIWSRVDETVIGDRQLKRILNQFDRTLRLLMEAAPQTKLDDLPLRSLGR